MLAPSLPKKPKKDRNPSSLMENALGSVGQVLQHQDHLSRLAAHHTLRYTQAQSLFGRELFARLWNFGWRLSGNTSLAADWIGYSVDAAQRSILYLDALRRRGDQFREHEAAGAPPVLAFDYEMVLDGRTLARPVNYALVKIAPGAAENASRRPYVIIDPRAGHGAGIGGTKVESQVGVARREGHPVYFVIFFQRPEPDQTLADVCAAEATFLKRVQELHPDAPKPVVIGNCQGGWAVMLLAASTPDLTGPVILNGAPLSYWAGKNGTNPMRYLGGLFGGGLPARIVSDLGGGYFDGANLVLNFELLNPGRVWWRKYYDLYAQVDDKADQFLKFERWWGGFFFLNTAEITWILDNLFIGNELSYGRAALGDRAPLDLRNIHAPIVVFASHGDNITPPQQALNWIADTYVDETEIKVRGQRIVYLLHDDVGHLGIFASSKIALHEHAQIVSTMKTLEALPPGLYELVIDDDDGDGHYQVHFEERRIADLLQHDDTREDESLFAPVDRLSRVSTEFYEIAFRPLVQTLATPTAVAAQVKLHPMRLSRTMLSSRNPLLFGLEHAARFVRRDRRPAKPDNLFSDLEGLWADVIEHQWNSWRDLRDGTYELLFHAIYGSPLMRRLGATELAKHQPLPMADVRDLPTVQEALASAHVGGFPEAVVRMLLLLVKARGSVRRSRLERSAELLVHSAALETHSEEERAELVRRQAILVELEPARALATLPVLLAEEDRLRALDLVDRVAGPLDEMGPKTREMRLAIRRQLGVERVQDRADA